CAGPQPTASAPASANRREENIVNHRPRPAPSECSRASSGSFRPLAPPVPMSVALLHLRERLAEVFDLHRAAAVLEWDQETYMPPGGAEARARQVATLRRLAHERFTDDAVGAWLEAAERETDGPGEDDYDRA